MMELHFLSTIVILFQHSFFKWKCPRALGNRSILAAPFQERTRVRLNEINQREQFGPIAPISLKDEAAKWFGCDQPSPFILFTYTVRTIALSAVTHVN